jgi:hypothetical protein
MDVMEIVMRIVKYLIEGLAVGAAAWAVGRRKLKMEEVVIIAITAAVTLIILDTFSSQIGDSTRLGAGVALGAKIVGGIPTVAL